MAHPHCGCVAVTCRRKSSRAACSTRWCRSRPGGAATKPALLEEPDGERRCELPTPSPPIVAFAGLTGLAAQESLPPGVVAVAVLDPGDGLKTTDIALSSTTDSGMNAGLGTDLLAVAEFHWGFPGIKQRPTRRPSARPVTSIVRQAHPASADRSTTRKWGYPCVLRLSC